MLSSHRGILASLSGRHASLRWLPIAALANNPSGINDLVALGFVEISSDGRRARLTKDGLEVAQVLKEQYGTPDAD